MTLSLDRSPCLAQGPCEGQSPEAKAAGISPPGRRAAFRARHYCLLVHLELVQPQAPVLHLEQQLRWQRGAELAQRVLVLPQPQLERLVMVIQVLMIEISIDCSLE